MPMFETTSEYTLEEYLKFQKTVLLRVKHFVLICAVIIALVAWLGLKEGSVQVLLIAALIPVSAWFSIIWNGKRAYKSNIALQGMVSRYQFYEDHFVADNQLGTHSMDYSRIYRFLETKTNFYIMTSKNAGCIIEKNNCSPEMMEFLRRIPSHKKKA